MAISDQPDNNLYMDSGATNHMVQTTGNLENSLPFKGTDSVMVGNGDNLHISYIGNKHIGKKNLYLKDVFVVPNSRITLFSLVNL